MVDKKEKEGVEFFDDCSICQAMKEGKADSEEELRAAFQKAKDRGAVVFGTWFDEGKK